MSAPVIILGIVLPILCAYAISTQLQGLTDQAMGVNPSQAVSPMPYETQALVGPWRGFSNNNVPIRLVVEKVHSNWALVHFAWGKGGGGSTAQGSMWTRAKILPHGRLCISHPVHLILTLSEDSRSLVGTTVHADPLASVLLTRVGEEWGRIAFTR